MLKTILVDDNPFFLELLKDICSSSGKIKIVGAFTTAQSALSYSCGHPVEFALIDIGMPDLDGIDLGLKLRQLCPGIVLIFISALEERCLDAMRIKADFYIDKPATVSDILDAVDRACLLSLRQKKRPFVHTFGRFDVFCGDEAVYFPNAKSKELLALCIDRAGGDVSMEEAIDILWPERPYDDRVKTLYRKAIMKLRQALKEAGIGYIFEHHRGTCNVNPRLIECDYFNFLSGDPKAVASFRDIYMFEYSWAEETTARLSEKHFRSADAVFPAL